MAGNVKQTVQWFPGHMAKTRRKIEESMKLVDGVIEIADARVPESSRNPELETLRGEKPVLLLLNKADLADKVATDRWIEWYESHGIPAMAVDCRSGKGLNKIQTKSNEVWAERLKRHEEKGMAGRALRLMVVGIPNTGKSSFINRLCGGKRTKVGDRPGVTRTNQWVVTKQGSELLDTPGVLWPKFEDPEVGDKLAFIGSVKSEVLDVETMAVRLLEFLKGPYGNRIQERYKLSDGATSLPPYELLIEIGRKRGMLISGGEVDTERAANMLLDEYRSGKLGRLTLEWPED